jgi:pSer/pThr/pTyr-binding forkhead associated (FHA) protein
MITLILKLKDTQIEEFNLGKSIINIGRSKENDIVIDNIAVSHKHAQIELKEGKGYVLRDLHSSNGTFLNGAQIDANDHALHEGDAIGLAKFELLIKGFPQAPKDAPKVPPQEDVEGTMIFDAARRKPTLEPAAIPEHKVFHWPVLSATTGPSRGKEFKITKEVTTVGKGPQDDIPAEGWFVSSPQAKIVRHGDRFYISHVGGFLSGTKVNKIEIRVEHILKNKDEIEIGNCTFVFTQSFTDAPE